MSARMGTNMIDTLETHVKRDANARALARSFLLPRIHPHPSNIASAVCSPQTKSSSYSSGRTEMPLDGLPGRDSPQPISTPSIASS
jgi:hypothetical protein